MSWPDRAQLLLGQLELESLVDVDALVPDIERRIEAKRTISFAIASARSVAASGVAVAKAQMSGGDDEVGGQPFYVPLPRAGRVSSKSLTSKIKWRPA